MKRELVEAYASVALSTSRCEMPLKRPAPLPSPCSRTLPPAIVAVPVKVAFAVITNEPDPVLVIPADPVIVEPIVAVPDATPIVGVVPLSVIVPPVTVYPSV